MPHDRPRVGAASARSYGLIATMLAVMLGLGILMMQSGALDAINASGLFGH